MVGTKAGMHHLYKLKKKHEQEHYEPYQADEFHKFYDNFMFVAASVAPILGLPQLFKIWTEQSAAGLSLFSWSAFTVISGLWIIYGILHKAKPIFISSIAWLIIHLLVVIGILRFG